MRTSEFSKSLKKIEVADGFQTAVPTISDGEKVKEDPISDPNSIKKKKLINSLPTILETPDEFLTAAPDHDGSVFGEHHDKYNDADKYNASSSNTIKHILTQILMLRMWRLR